MWLSLRQVKILAAAIAASCLCSATLICAWAGEESLSEVVLKLEAAAALPHQPERSLRDRVAALEAKIFGRTGSGSLLERVERLERWRAGSEPKSRGGKAQRAGQPGAAAGAEAPGSGNATAAPQGADGPGVQSGYVSEGAGSTYPAGAAPQAPAPGAPLAAPAPGSTRLSELTRWIPLRPIVCPPHFVRIEPPGAPGGSGDYFADVMTATRGKVFRFKTMPIPVYITPYQAPGFTESCIKGFEMWEEQTRGAVRFVQVDDPSLARIRVIWSRLGLSSDPKGCTLGAHTTLRWKSRGSGTLATVGVGVVPVPVYIPRLGPKYVVPPQVIEVNLDLIMSKHPEVRYLILQNVVAHELGHALGLLGHSSNRTDLMYPITDEHSRLSARDINTITRLYEQKVDVPL